MQPALVKSICHCFAFSRTLVLALALLLGLAAATSQAAVGTLINDAELRDKPSLEGKSGARIKSSTQVEILGTQGAWFEVKTHDGKRGWLRLMNVRPGEKQHWSDKITSSVGSVGAVVRTASTSSTATTGVKGISKEELENATPNFEEVKLLDRFAVTPAEARKFAGEQKIKPQTITVLMAQDDAPKE